MRLISAASANNLRFSYGILLLAVFLLSSGCTYVPDALNPIEWYRGVTAWFSDEEEDVGTARGDWEVPGADEAYPNLATVPEAPTASQRQRIAEGLVADTMHRRYIDETEEPREAAIEAQQEAQPEGVGPPSAGPAAAPRAPVQGAEIGAPPPPPPVPRLSELPMAPPAPTPAPSEIAAPVSPPQAEPAAAKEKADVQEAAGPGSLEDFDASKSLVSIRAGTVLFANGSARLSGADRRRLKKIAALTEERGGMLRVIGHASSRTSNMDPLRHQLVNFDISVRRANNVVGALIEYGVKAEKIFVSAMSDSEPVYYEVMPAGEAGNRRAEIYLDY